MSAHELAAKLLAGPDHPVIINGWGSMEGVAYEVNSLSALDAAEFIGENDGPHTPTKYLDWPIDRPCVSLHHKERQATIDLSDGVFQSQAIMDESSILPLVWEPAL
jgi:hypothetical protein